MCAQLMKILPTNLSFEMLSKADDMGKQSSDALIDWMRAKSTFINEHGANEIHMFLSWQRDWRHRPSGLLCPLPALRAARRRPRRQLRADAGGAFYHG